MTKEKYCNFTGFLILLISSIIFGVMIGLAVSNLIKAQNTGISELDSDLLTGAAYFQVVYAFSAIILGMVISAILFALEKIISLLSLNRVYVKKELN